MKELQCQSLVVKAVNAHGGKSFKMANRFLVGVSDLYVQLPGCFTFLWEAKLIKKKFNDYDTYDVDLTPPQRNFINDVLKAGGHAGTMSFIQDKHELYMAVVRGVTECLPAAAYKKLGRGTREKDIVDYLFTVSHVDWRRM